MFDDTRMRSFDAEREALLAAAKPSLHPSLPQLLEANRGLRMIVSRPIVTPMSGGSGSVPFALHLCGLRHKCEESDIFMIGGADGHHILVLRVPITPLLLQVFHCLDPDRGIP